jgi:CubicO group peptidase (beta-lactamase class C family)
MIFKQLLRRFSLQGSQNMTVPTIVPELAARIPDWLEELALPGLSLALVEDGSLAWAAGFGLRDKAAGLPVTDETIFNAASISKPVFACLVFQLVETGQLDLDAPLSCYLPEPYLPDEPRLDEITARRVLCHTTGFPNWRAEPGSLPVFFPPGQRFSYSGEGYVYLQRVVEQICRQPLSEAIQGGLFAPLGMLDSSFTWEERFEGRAAMNYDEQGAPADQHRPSQANAAYTLLTTPSDLARWMASLLGETGPSLMHPVSLEAMFTPQVAANDLAPWKDTWPDGSYTPYPDVFWGLGWGIQDGQGERAFFHWGDNGIAHAFAIGFPASRRGMVAMVNSANGLSLWKPLFGLVFGDDLPAIRWLENMYAH